MRNFTLYKSKVVYRSLYSMLSKEFIQYLKSYEDVDVYEDITPKTVKEIEFKAPEQKVLAKVFVTVTK